LSPAAVRVWPVLSVHSLGTIILSFRERTNLQSSTGIIIDKLPRDFQAFTTMSRPSFAVQFLTTIVSNMVHGYLRKFYITIPKTVNNVGAMMVLRTLLFVPPTFIANIDEVVIYASQVIMGCSSGWN